MADDLTPAETGERDQALADLDDPANLIYPHAFHSVHYDRERGYVVTRTTVEVIEAFPTGDAARAFIEEAP